MSKYVNWYRNYFKKNYCSIYNLQYRRVQDNILLWSLGVLPLGPYLPCQGLYLASVVEQDSRLIVNGGACGGIYQACVWTLDTKVSGATWQQASSMNTARLGHVSFILDNLVYLACGRRQGQIFLSSVGVIDFTHRQPH